MVPNLPSPLRIPAPGAPVAPETDGAGIDFFARLLGGGPMLALTAGPGEMPAGDVTLRAAPADGDPEGADCEAVPDVAVPGDIIPLMQAQSGFAVVVAPAGSADEAAVTPAPAPAAGTPAPEASAVAQAVRATIQAARDGRTVGTESDGASTSNGLGPAVKAAVQAVKAGDEKPAADVVGAAVSPLVGKVRGKPDAGTGGVAAQSDAASENALEQPVVTGGQQRRQEPAAMRTEPAGQTAAMPAATPVIPAFAGAPPVPQPASAVAATPDAAPDVARLVVERQLDLASDNQWLDRLARDIARAGASDEPLRFRLHPQTLGHLQVELTQGDRGATVRLTVETEAARSILMDAQPRLAAEARAQGVRLAGTEVDLGTASQQGDARRQAEAEPQNIVRVVRSAQSATTSSEPVRSRSDRYA